MNREEKAEGALADQSSRWYYCEASFWDCAQNVP